MSVGVVEDLIAAGLGGLLLEVGGRSVGYLRVTLLEDVYT